MNPGGMYPLMSQRSLRAAARLDTPQLSTRRNEKVGGEVTKFLSGVVATMMLTMMLGCSERSSRNLPTKEAQQELVAGLAPVDPLVRWRRAVPNPRPSATLPRPQDEDLRGTPTETAWSAMEANILSTLASDPTWTEKTPAGKERLSRLRGTICDWNQCDALLRDL